MNHDWQSHLGRLKEQIADLHEQIAEVKETLNLIEPAVQEQRAILQRTTDDLRNSLTQGDPNKPFYQLPSVLKVLNTPSVGAILVDSEGRYLMFNAIAEELIGLHVKGGTTDDDSGEFGFHLPDKTTKCKIEQLPWQRCIRDSLNHEELLFVRRPDVVDGIWVRVIAVAILDEKGANSGAVAFLLDTTEQILVEGQLKELLSTFQNQLTSLEKAQLLLIELLQRLSSNYGGKEGVEQAPSDGVAKPPAVSSKPTAMPAKSSTIPDKNAESSFEPQQDSELSTEPKATHEKDDLIILPNAEPIAPLKTPTAKQQPVEMKTEDKKPTTKLPSAEPSSDSISPAAPKNVKSSSSGADLVADLEKSNNSGALNVASDASVKETATQNSVTPETMAHKSPSETYGNLPAMTALTALTSGKPPALNHEAPAAPEAGSVNPEEERAKLRKRLRSNLVLVVDDIPVNQKLLSMQLSRLNFSVDIVANGKEAVDAVVKKDYDLVFMDLDMPIMDGITATRTIREIEAKTFKHVPIVAMTSYKREIDRERCLRAGMDDYLVKGASRKQLLDVIDKHSRPYLDDDPKFAAVLEENAAAAKADAELDVTMLESLHGRDAMQEISRLFYSSANTFIECLELAIDEKNVDAVLHFTHCIKGPASSLGLTQLSEILNSLLISAENQDWTQVCLHYMRLRSNYSQVLERLRTMFGPSLLQTATVQ